MQELCLLPAWRGTDPLIQWGNTVWNPGEGLKVSEHPPLPPPMVNWFPGPTLRLGCGDGPVPLGPHLVLRNWDSWGVYNLLLDQEVDPSSFWWRARSWSIVSSECWGKTENKQKLWPADKTNLRSLAKRRVVFTPGISRIKTLSHWVALRKGTCLAQKQILRGTWRYQEITHVCDCQGQDQGKGLPWQQISFCWL